MNRPLKRLRKQARAHVSPETYGEPLKQNLDNYVEEFKTIDGRSINIEPLIDLIRVGTHKFYDDEPSKSDAWLAPRLHATLRLYRSEAAELEMWEYLTICISEIREYVVWRWGKAGTLNKSMDRVWGSKRRHTLARLWWIAELTRNGSDYTPTVDLLQSQDAANYLTDTLMFNNRPAAVAFTRMVKETLEAGGNKKDAVQIAKSLNHMLVTVVLDSLALSQDTQLDDYEPWVREQVDQTLLYNDFPIGPNEPRVLEEQISAALELMNFKKK